MAKRPIHPELYLFLPGVAITPLTNIVIRIFGTEMPDWLSGLVMGVGLALVITYVVVQRKTFKKKLTGTE